MNNVVMKNVNKNNIYDADNKNDNQFEENYMKILNEVNGVKHFIVLKKSNV